MKKETTMSRLFRAITVGIMPVKPKETMKLYDIKPPAKDEKGQKERKR